LHNTNAAKLKYTRIFASRPMAVGLSVWRFRQSVLSFYWFSY